MNKIIRATSLSVIAFIVLITSCANVSDTDNSSFPDVDNVELLDVNESNFTYAIGENILGFTVDESGIVYTGVLGDDFSGNKIVAYNLDGSTLRAYNVDVDKTDGIISTLYMAVGNKKIYYSVAYVTGEQGSYEYAYETNVIYELDLLSGNTKRITLPITLNKVQKLAFFDGRLYILAGNRVTLPEFPNLITYDTIFYLACYNIATSTYEVLFEDIYSFSLSPNGNLFVAGADANNGYFAELDTDTWTLSNLQYIDVGIITNMAVDNRGIIFSAMHSGSELAFSSSGLGYMYIDSNSVVPVLSGVMVSTFLYMKGFCWYISSNDGVFKLERIKMSDYVSEMREIKMLKANADATDDEFVPGFILNKSVVSDEELALSMLSYDSVFDVFLVSSDEQIAYNVREKGAYYPLNDVPYVQEYINACFPFIQDAATDADSNIWMLPIYVGFDFFLVNADNVANSGADINNLQYPQDILHLLMEVYDTDTGSFFFNFPRFISHCLIIYLREANTLDTLEFRAFAEGMKTYQRLGDSMWGNVISLNFSETPSDLILYQNIHRSFNKNSIVLDSDIFDNFDIVPLTGKSDAPSVFTNFLCINPNSDNLEIALDFVSSIAQHKLSERDSFLLTDIDTYSDVQYVRELYSSFENSIIDFNIPHEMLYFPFIDYLNDIMTLDEFVSEADRMLGMYFNE